MAAYMQDRDTFPEFIERLKCVRLLAGGLADFSDLEIVEGVLAEETGRKPDPANERASKALLDFRCDVLATSAAPTFLPEIPDGAHLTVRRGRGRHSQVWVRFDRGNLVRQFRHLFIECPSLQECRGMPLPAEVLSRLVAALERPAMASHLAATAADHMTEWLLEMCMEIPGAVRLPDGSVSWAVSCTRKQMTAATEWLRLPGPGRFATAVDIFLAPEDPR